MRIERFESLPCFELGRRWRCRGDRDGEGDGDGDGEGNGDGDGEGNGDGDSEGEEETEISEEDGVIEIINAPASLGDRIRCGFNFHIFADFFVHCAITNATGQGASVRH
jgi:hypothetical protein